MALSEELPLYKDSYNLFLMVVESVKSYPNFTITILANGW
jgi:hypothetical protein